MTTVVVIVNGRGLSIDGVVYVNVRVSRHSKEELPWVIDKRLRAVSNKMLFKTVVPLRN